MGAAVTFCVKDGSWDLEDGQQKQTNNNNNKNRLDSHVLSHISLLRAASHPPYSLPPLFFFITFLFLFSLPLPPLCSLLTYSFVFSCLLRLLLLSLIPSCLPPSLPLCFGARLFICFANLQNASASLIFSYFPWFLLVYLPPPFLSFLPSFLPSCLSVCLPSFLPSLPLSLPLCFVACLFILLLSFIPSCLPPSLKL